MIKFQEYKRLRVFLVDRNSKYLRSKKPTSYKEKLAELENNFFFTFAWRLTKEPGSWNTKMKMPTSPLACTFLHFPIPSSFVMSRVRLNCKVLCHGNRVRVTGSFLRRSYITDLIKSIAVDKKKDINNLTIERNEWENWSAEWPAHFLNSISWWKF